MTSSSIARRRAAARAEGSARYVERRRAVLDAAQQLFQERGVERTSLDDVAAAAGTDRASLYYYVAGKKELFYDVVRDILEVTAVSAESIQAGPGTPKEKLHRLATMLMASYQQRPYLQTFLSETSAGLSREGAVGRQLLALVEAFDQALLAIVEEGVATGAFRADLPPRVVANGFLGMINWTHRWFDPNGELDGAGLGDMFATIVTEGMEHRRGPSTTR
ncbi:TetR/AcrR family transcriptional regulator [Pseudonocardia sp. GCM10023141]|uniref:TetR/AcrR family transcriptional regulator n=1 Tax=Pseudonocardia sp. GCM10023141 TaxID=3252653 RepID=UPI003617D0D3